MSRAKSEFQDLRSRRFSNAELRGRDFRGCIFGISDQRRRVLLVILMVFAGLAGTLLALPIYVSSLALEASTYSGMFGVTYGALEELVLWGYIQIALIFYSILTFSLFRSQLQKAVIVVAMPILGLLFALPFYQFAGVPFVATISLCAGHTVLLFVVLCVRAIEPGGRIWIMAVGSALASMLGSLYLAPDSTNDILSAGLTIGISLSIFWTARAKTSGQDMSEFCKSAAIFVSAFATSFRGSDLSETNFAGTHLALVDFRGSTLDGAQWLNATGIDKAVTSGTALDSPPCRKLLSTGTAEHAQLINVALPSAKLDNALLIGANLSGSNFDRASLRSTNLTDANLNGATFRGTDLTGATLTGASIHNWQVTVDTVLDDVICDHIFVGSQAFQSRRPLDPQKSFLPGEFRDLLKSITRALKIYASYDTDPSRPALAIGHLLKEFGAGKLSISGVEVLDAGYNMRIALGDGLDSSTVEDRYTQEITRLNQLGKDELIREIVMSKRFFDAALSAIANGTNIQFNTEVIVGDKKVIGRDNYEIGQAIAVGPEASASGNSLNQFSQEHMENIDLWALATELEQLRTALLREATTIERHEIISVLESAQAAAKNGDGQMALSYLEKVDKWALVKATKIGVGVASAAIKTAARL